MHAFMQRAADVAGQPFARYEELHRWSVENIEAFWTLWLQESGIIFDGETSPALERKQLPFAPFFPRVRLNFAENLLRHRERSGVALRDEGESRPSAQLSNRELATRVASLATQLRRWGVTSGDRVTGYVPNYSKTLIAMLATASLGATWASCSPDFGTKAILDRFGQIAPKVLFAANGYTYNGKVFDLRERIVEVAKGITSIRHVVVFTFTPTIPNAISALGEKFTRWETTQTDRGEKLSFTRVPFNHPLFIMFSSGTTGVPKCIVHGSGGTLLQLTKELVLHSDVRPGDHLTYYTTCGWMMWNWLVSGLFTGATLTLYDGSPSFPSLDKLWKLADETGITHFGTSAKFIGTCRGHISPIHSLRLQKLRVILSTGSPLLPEDFDWVYAHVKKDVQLSSISGGTDIISCFMLGNPLLPVYRGEIQCFGLGMDVAAFDDRSKPVTHQKGELVCRKPFPSAPISFWDDAGHEKYRKAYFSRQENTWYHGDYIEVTETQGSCGGIVVYGRSDATLNPGGVRIGTAEIYRLVETLPEISDSIVVGQPWEGDVRVVLFVMLATGIRWSEELDYKIRKTIREGASPRHVPAIIKAVTKIPYTISGKKVELAVLELLCGREPKNKEALADPTALEVYRNLVL
jgi:acetoacetyl-CoA synthetase